ncbi:MAG: TIGR03016 family PEP-CTERM system-associated outer membrane protein [Betaproteobacteria bacterium]|nr:TIGR03016 family PEP-CTERM system-associated outer membrane protein [Betaproteobacteria bacterium]
MAMLPLNSAIRVVCLGLAANLLAKPATGQVVAPAPPAAGSGQIQAPAPGRDQVVAPVPPAAGGAQIQPPESARLRPWRITPQLRVSETYTDNVALAPPGTARSDWVTDVSPGIRAEGSGPRVRGFFDYALHRIFYANDPRLNNSQNALNSLVTVEVLENRFFVDARASISQQNRSAFSAVAPDTASATANRVETSVYQLAPYLRGRISDLATYQLRLNATQSSSRGVTSSNTVTTEWLGSVRSATPSAKIGWAVDGTALTVERNAAGRSQATRARGSLIYQFDPYLNASVYEGIETTEFANADRQSALTPGIGMAWTPTNRTQVAAIREKRFFGPGQTLRFSHRTSRMAFTYNDDKEVVAVSNLIAASGPGTLATLMSDLLASSNPDPALRAQAVSSRLQSSGQPASASSVAGFNTGRAFLRRNRQGSAAMIGANNTLTLTLITLDQQTLGGVSAGPTDSFSVSPSIRQRTLRAAWAHTISALSSLTVTGSRLNAEGLTGTAAAVSSQRTLGFVLTRHMAAQTIASIGSRHSRFESTVAGDHRENAILATLTTRF